MRYLVTFRKRFDLSGEPSDNPASLLNVEDGVIEGAEMMEILQPPSIHASEDIGGSPTSQSGEDDGFLAFGTETWVFDVAEGRDGDFKAAVANSEVALEIQEFDDEMMRKPFADG